jgi:hypothetical protein
MMLEGNQLIRASIELQGKLSTAINENKWDCPLVSSPNLFDHTDPTIPMESIKCTYGMADIFAYSR